MTILKLSEAKAHLGRYARNVAKGESYIIADHNRPIAQLVPTESKDSTTGVCPKIGLYENTLEIPGDFDHPIEDFEKDFYGA